MLKHKMTVIDLKLYSYFFICNFNNINKNIFIPNSLGHYWDCPHFLTKLFLLRDMFLVEMEKRFISYFLMLRI